VGVGVCVRISVSVQSLFLLIFVPNVVLVFSSLFTLLNIRICVTLRCDVYAVCQF